VACDLIGDWTNAAESGCNALYMWGRNRGVPLPSHVPQVTLPFPKQTLQGVSGFTTATFGTPLCVSTQTGSGAFELLKPDQAAVKGRTRERLGAWVADPSFVRTSSFAGAEFTEATTCIGQA